MDENSENTKKAREAREQHNPIRIIEEELSRQIISCFYKVYNKLGYGRLEAVYRAALVHELRKLGLKVRTEVPLDVWYDGIIIATYRADVMVEDRVILELKAGPKLDPSWHGQLLNNLRTCDLELGILLFFGPRPYFKRLVWATNEGRKKDDS
jgi:GxxExxY protein